ncbi:MAG: DUF6599 family protein [Candidatus Aminicenantes bacterium]
MQIVKYTKAIIFFWVVLFLCLSPGNRVSGAEDQQSSLLPDMEGWEYSEEPQIYFPETLYEYIDGAAEIYLSYDFRKLMVGQYKKRDTTASVSVEIYDMGNEKNSFGIYSAERFPDAQFVSAGTQGYVEEGAMNFLIGKYYIKLLCFDCEDKSDKFLRLFSKEFLNKIEEKGQFPHLVRRFPEQGLVLNSEKFILKNFMGYEFFHDGYLADYEFEGTDFQCFFIEGEDAQEAQNMLERYLEVKSGRSQKKMDRGYHLKDSYYHHIYLARVENFLCGVVNIKDGYEEMGKRYLDTLLASLKNSPIP